jgi:hypothetical protein
MMEKAGDKAAVLRKMPIGIQDFEDLRTSGYIYVDKTAYVWKLVTKGKPYFLSVLAALGRASC